MRKTITCIICPNGCLLSADVSEPGTDAPVTGAENPRSIDSPVTGTGCPRVIDSPVTGAGCPRVIDSPVTGAGCPRGEAYFIQEITDPRRTLTSSVLVKGGELPLCSGDPENESRSAPRIRNCPHPGCSWARKRCDHDENHPADHSRTVKECVLHLARHDRQSRSRRKKRHACSAPRAARQERRGVPDKKHHRNRFANPVIII